MLAYYIQTLNPFIWQWGHSNFGIRWYGTAYLMGFIIAYLLMKRFIKTGRMRLPREKLPDFVLFVAIFGVLVGGRLGEAILYRPHMFTNFSPPFPYWGLLKVQDGGMAAHGGILGVLVAVWIFARRNGYRFLNLLDCAAMVAPIGIFFGRIANFINGELYGHVWHSPLAVQFPTELIFPPQLKEYRRVSPGAVHHLEEQIVVRHPSLAHAMAVNPRLTIVNLAREGHPFVIARLREILPPRIPSQLIEASLEGLLLFLLCYFIGRRWWKEGVAAGAFATLYPIMRIIGEQFRDGDQPKHIFGHWISLGVIYSVPLLIGGLIFWIWVILRKVQPAAAALSRPGARATPPDPVGSGTQTRDTSEGV